jgi:hypothetical protein
VNAGWDHAPHLTEKDKADLRASIPPYQLDARSKGIPQLGSGAIYPVPESEFLCDPFVIPEWMPQSYALDVGWNRTAALWQAHDPENDVVYLYGEHYRAQAEPAIHAEAIKARGVWIPGVIDPAGRGSNQKDGERLIEIYQKLGLELTPADNSVEAGILEVWQRLSTGRLKVFRTLQSFMKEFRFYRRDDKGRVVKQDDHLMDCGRYGIVSGLKVARIRPSSMWTLGRDNHFKADYDPFSGT